MKSHGSLTSFKEWPAHPQSRGLGPFVCFQQQVSLQCNGKLCCHLRDGHLHDPCPLHGSNSAIQIIMGAFTQCTAALYRLPACLRLTDDGSWFGSLLFELPCCVACRRW